MIDQLNMSGKTKVETAIERIKTLAAKSIDGSRGEMVARVCRGQRSHYKNHHFAKYDDYKNGTIPQFKGRCTRKASVSLWR